MRTELALSAEATTTGSARATARAGASLKSCVTVIEGEPPYDIFVRWKPLHHQPIGWEPEIDDGVRLNIHPTNPNIVFYGDIRLWKTTTGDGPWTSVAIQHTDQHAFAYDPVTPSTVLACNDGGVYRSTDTGMTWTHCNRDLQTLEYISIAQHPQWETVMIGGTQDNGTQRYVGSPAWRLSAGGDGGFRPSTRRCQRGS